MVYSQERLKVRFPVVPPQRAKAKSASPLSRSPVRAVLPELSWATMRMVQPESSGSEEESWSAWEPEKRTAGWPPMPLAMTIGR